MGYTYSNGREGKRECFEGCDRSTTILLFSLPDVSDIHSGKRIGYCYDFSCVLCSDYFSQRLW